MAPPLLDFAVARPDFAASKLAGERTAPTSAGEKFRDPWFDATGRGNGPDHPYATTSEPYYLADVPRDAAARVDAMIARAPELAKRASPGVDAMRKAAAKIRKRDEANDKSAKDAAHKMAQAMAMLGPAGAAVGMALEGIVAVSAGIAGWFRDKDAAETEEGQKLVNEASAATLAAGYPPLYNLMYSAELWGGSPLGLAQIAQAHQAKWELLPIPEARAVQAWWSLAIWHSQEPEVVAYLKAFPSSFGTGNSLGTDEQVMLAAAPLAAEYGIPIRELAIRIYKATPAWDRRPELYQLDPTIRVPANVYQINTANLAQTGFRIAGELTAETKAAAAAAAPLAALAAAAALPTSLQARALPPTGTPAQRAAKGAAAASGAAALAWPLARFLLARIV